MNEHTFQVNVVRALQCANIFVFSIPNAQQLLSKIPLNRRGMFVKYLKSEGMMSGASDLVILLPKGRVVFLELKNPYVKYTKQSDTQKEFEKNVAALGFDYRLIDNFTDIEKFIDEVINEKR